MTNYQKTQITCQDGYTLSAHFYPAHEVSSKLPVLLCPATGITKQFYHKYCSWLQEQGYDVSVFDFRGIGESLQGSIKKSKASIVQWGQLDISAAIDALLAQTQKSQVVLLGHSAGGQLLGIVPNYHKVAKVVAVSGSTGHVKGLAGKTRILGPVMFDMIFPIARYTLGYGPTQAIGMGENLPKDVAKQWAEFCNKPGYVINAIGKTVQSKDDFHQDIRCPITVLWSSDDEIATKTNVQDLLRLYPNAQTQDIELEPQNYGYKEIGHMLMFKSSHQKLWAIIEHELNAT